MYNLVTSSGAGAQYPTPHIHCTNLDASGNGVTIGDSSGHAHQVAGYRVLPSVDGHTHQTLNAACQPQAGMGGYPQQQQGYTHHHGHTQPKPGCSSCMKR